MENIPNILPYSISLVIVLIYFIFFFKENKTPPDLTKVLVVFTSIIGSYYAFILMFKIILTAEKDLGILHDQRIIIVVGCFAVIWIGIFSSIDVFAEIKKNK